jgi:hypothetical protein
LGSVVGVVEVESRTWVPRVISNEVVSIASLIGTRFLAHPPDYVSHVDDITQNRGHQNRVDIHFRPVYTRWTCVARATGHCERQNHEGLTLYRRSRRDVFNPSFRL